VRNVLLRYSEAGDTVLDQMCGSGTTLVECKLLGRNAIGVDINPESIMLTCDRLDFKMPVTLNHFDGVKPTIKTYVGDARNLNEIGDSSIDLIATHPPYVNIIPYSKNLLNDLSAVHSVDEFMREMAVVARECYRMLNPGKYCVILIGDIRRKKYHIPISYNVLQVFQENGFVLKEDIIKKQWRCKSTPFWIKMSYQYNFLLLAYEHLFVFEKTLKDK
jgi:DNA modification methylase